MQVSIYRYDPAKDSAPYMQDVEVEIPEGKDLMVLDVLELMKAKDPSVAYRRSCREGVCGSDGMNMNGNNGLACITPVSQVAKKNKLVLRPLPGLPVVRDLVVDMTQFYRQYEKVKPFLLNDSPAPAQSASSHRKIGKSSTDSTSASFAPVARPPVLPSGGTRINSSVPQGCSRLIGSCPIRGTRPQRSALSRSTIPLASSAAGAS